jgi:hypothetical protein
MGDGEVPEERLHGTARVAQTKAGDRSMELDAAQAVENR